MENVIETGDDREEDKTEEGKRQTWHALDKRGRKELDRYKATGDPICLEEAVNCFRRSFSMISLGVGDSAHTFANLGSALQARFKQLGNLVDLDEAIICLEGALELKPVGHPDRFTKFYNLANALMTRFGQFGDRADMDRAIILYQHALELVHPGHPTPSKVLINLAGAFHTRFNQFGNRADLDQAIIYDKVSLELEPPGHPNHSKILLHLADHLEARFKLVRDRADLDQALIHYQNRLELTPPGHPSRFKSLNNLAAGLLTRFRENEDRSDLDQAIAYTQTALELLRPGHSDQSTVLLCLAEALTTRFKRVRDRADLEQAIVYSRTRLELTPPGHPGRFRSLTTLGSVFLIRFNKFGDQVDLDQATVCEQDALDLMPLGHPNRPSCLCDLARALKRSLEREVPPNSTQSSGTTSIIFDGRNRIINLLRDATSASSCGPPHDRLQASLVWISDAVRWSHPSALEAYRVALELLETMVATGRSMESRHLQITSARSPKTRTLAMDAAAFALNSGQIETAVELLEQGRSVLLAQAGQYRTRVDELRIVDTTLADEFSSLCDLMESSILSTDMDKVDVIEDPPATGSTDEVASYIKLSERWKFAVDQIRRLEGFETFLRPTPFTTLRNAASDGPVILLNISKQRSDAIIMYSDNAPLAVSLPNATPKALGRMARSANEKTQRKDFDTLLKDVWERIVQPVVQYLQHDLKLVKGSRIWWCPTGAACRLPIHAAGIYSKRDQILPNIYVSSYTSTLSALIRAREGIPKIPTTAPNLLVVGQADTPGLLPLPSVPLELDRVTSAVSYATIITGKLCTREVVLQAMPQYTWTHIACHGHVDQNQPFRSHFSLQDEPITLLDIAAQNLPNAELAFLAACHCHSAEGDIDRPDEVLHLAAGLQFAGVRSVVGTLWGMCDDDGPDIAHAFYSKLMIDMAKGAGSSAHAIHWAVGELRKQRPSIPSSRWACFVHYGC